MADDEYEMIPHKILSDLRYDIDALKKKLTQPDAKINELILEIESMKDAVHELTSIFQKSLDEIKQEGDVTKTIAAIKEKLDTVLTQNETIAKGMIAVSDKVDDFVAGAPGVTQSPGMSSRPAAFSNNPAMPPMMGPPISHGPARMAPPPQMGFSGMSSAGSGELPESDEGDFPPPPPSMMPRVNKKRTGLFS